MIEWLRPTSVRLLPFVFGIVVGPLSAVDPEPSTVIADSVSRLTEVRREIARLEDELEKMAGREQGLLGELERLGAEQSLREREFEEVSLQLEEVGAEIAKHDQALAGLDRAQLERREYLLFRLREIYKAGPDDWLRRVVEGESVDQYWKALSYASYLSQRDRDVLSALHRDETVSERERSELESARTRLAELQSDLGRKRERLAAARRERAGALARLREDQTTRRTALGELEVAAEQLTTLVESLAEEGEAVELDIRKFRGLLDWPARGPLAAEYGKIVHPRFKTEVPHPGWDIDAPLGSDIRTVFDGEVVFSSWMRGYGLTTIVNHGGGMLSIYAHASVLLTQNGERVVRGQVLGKIGETGSLRGPYLYFELRDGGRPTDPRPWLRRR